MKFRWLQNIKMKKIHIEIDPFFCGPNQTSFNIRSHVKWLIYAILIAKWNQIEVQQPRSFSPCSWEEKKCFAFVKFHFDCVPNSFTETITLEWQKLLNVEHESDILVSLRCHRTRHEGKNIEHQHLETPNLNETKTHFKEQFPFFSLWRSLTTPFNFITCIWTL